MTPAEAVAFWYGRINYEVKSATPADLKLERMRALLRLLGDPHDRLRIVHVTGTKGKGSTCAMVAAILQAAGYRVGLFTSPHLERVEERIRVNGEPISPDELVARMTEVAPAVRRLDAMPFPPPTFFEISTALGFLHFALRRVDMAVVEVGLGGRFDSTNVCRPLVSVITSVGFDHTAQLGNTLEAIAYQKAGIIKPRVPVVSGVALSEPAAVIERIAHENDCRLIRLGREFSYQFTASTATIRTKFQTYPPFELGLLGEHQAANAALAVATAEVLGDSGLSLPDYAVAKGLKDVRWPARVEVISRRPWVVLDTAHNVPSVEALVKTLQSLPVNGRKALVFAVSNDKPYAEMLSILLKYFDHIHLTRYGNNPRCVPPESLAKLVPAERSTIHATAMAAWQVARNTAKFDDLVCIAGSVFLAGELQSAIRSAC